VRTSGSGSRVVTFSFALAVGLAVTAIGCGGSSGGKHDGGGGADGAGASGGADGQGDGSGNCVAEEPAGGVTSWVDDGVSRCALIIETNHMSGTSSDNFELIAVDPGDVSITLSVSTYGTALGGRSYHCQTDGGFILEDGGASEYVNFTYGGNYTTQGCMITITDPGAPGGENARGSFSATLVPLGGGATKTISNGVFDTPLTVTGG
jgi:hypothetical protein